MNRQPELPYLLAEVNDPPDDPPPPPPPPQEPPAGSTWSDQNGSIPSIPPSSSPVSWTFTGEGMSAGCGSNGQSYPVTVQAKKIEIKAGTHGVYTQCSCRHIYVDDQIYYGTQWAYLPGSVRVTKNT